MSFSWSGIVNNAKRDIGIGLKVFVAVEPIAVTYVAPFCPEAALIMGVAYKVAQIVEVGMSATPGNGPAKLTAATSVMNDGVLAVLQSSLVTSGKTLDATASVSAITAMLNAIVAENNAQAEVVALLQAAAAHNGTPDAGALTNTNMAVAAAVAEVQAAGIAFQNAIHPAGK